MWPEKHFGWSTGVSMRCSGLLRATAICLPVALAAAAAAPSAAASGNAPAGRPLTRNVTDKVIIVLKDQIAGIPDTVRDSARRTAAVLDLQRGVVAQLAATRARDIRSISLINAVAATVSPGEARLLAANPAVAHVIPDLPIPLASSPLLNRKAATPSGVTPPRGTCAPDGRVQLDPEAIENIHAATQSGKGDSAQALGYTGAGVKVAYIADGSTRTIRTSSAPTVSMSSSTTRTSPARGQARPPSGLRHSLIPVPSLLRGGTSTTSRTTALA